ncbi:hypothetical protein GOBAR_AA26866 [Gossypium barbadense]|uniref:Uncharacterized protein n=1 Tax=Gossypium barbadense TaxID=3634 RepID=A0A2P5WRV5_GOSBA|nr:hypothetical protein GOBAR_AA26866 [Gossypium barbadense]
MVEVKYNSYMVKIEPKTRPAVIDVTTQWVTHREKVAPNGHALGTGSTHWSCLRQRRRHWSHHLHRRHRPTVSGNGTGHSFSS